MGVSHERRPSVLQGEGGDAVDGSCGANAPSRWRLSIRSRQARPLPWGRGEIAREEVVRAGVGRGAWPKIASLSGGAGFGKLSASFNPDRGNQ